MEKILEVRDAALERLDPALLVSALAAHEGLGVARFDLLAIGKCAAKMIDGALEAGGDPAGRILGCIPRGYLAPATGEVVEGSHPVPDRSSFRAGERILAFVKAAERPVLLLLSGGGSACAEVAADGIDEKEIIEVNQLLLESGMPITDINRVRRRLSALKGGGIGNYLPPGSFVIIHPDVPPGRERDVASAPAFADRSSIREVQAILHRLGKPLGIRIAERLVTALSPQHPDPEWRLTIASHKVPLVLAALAREQGWSPMPAQEGSSLDGPVAAVASAIHDRLRSCRSSELVVGVGEPEVRVEGNGRGGRCTELAARLALLAIESGSDLRGVITSTDGVDGNSGLAGVVLDSGTWDDRPSLAVLIESALRRSDTASVAKALGGAVMMGATGNNLRDLSLLSCR